MILEKIQTNEITSNQYEIISGCGENTISYKVDLAKRTFSLPVIIDKTKTNKEKALESYEFLGICKNIESISEQNNEVILILNCLIGKTHIIYNFDTIHSELIFNENEFEELFPYFQSFIFPFLEENNQLNFIKKERQENSIKTYYELLS